MGIPKGVTPVAYWGIFSGSGTKRKENALISYGFLKAMRVVRVDLFSGRWSAVGYGVAVFFRGRLVLPVRRDPP